MTDFRKLIDLVGWDEFARTVGPTGPCIIATCHYGNFEWFSLAAGYAGLRATIISQEFKNPRLDPIFNRLRQQSGHQMVPREGAIVRLYKTLRRRGTRPARSCTGCSRTTSRAVTRSGPASCIGSTATPPA